MSDRWRVGKLLGRGGMSTVYAATHRTGKACAIKVLHPELAARASSRRRFLREGYIANRVAHDGVVSVFDDVVASDGTVFLVMELLAGTTLEQHCCARGGRLSPGDVLVIAEAILDVLIAAHAKGIVHRDLKPSNVFLTSNGTLKVLDFGIASLREISPGAGSTGTGVVLGTPGFIAPEQARGRWKEIDARTDLWGLGAMMFRLLTGRVVHDGETTNELVIAAATVDAPALAAIDPSIPPAIAALVDRALCAKADERWQSAVLLQAAVQAELSKIPHGGLPRPVPHSGDATTLDESASAPLTHEGDLVLDAERDRIKKAPGLRGWPVYVTAVAVVALFIALTPAKRNDTADPKVESIVTVAPASSPLASAMALAPDKAHPPIVSARANPTPRSKPRSRPSSYRASPRAAPASSTPQETAVAPTPASSAPAPRDAIPTKLEDVLNERQ